MLSLCLLCVTIINQLVERYGYYSDCRPPYLMQKGNIMINIIPLPNEYKTTSAVFNCVDELKLNSDFELKLVKCERSDDGKLIVKKDASLGEEEYTLDIDKEKILITTSTQIGAYYALQSLRQLCKAELGEVSVQCCNIKDKPRFKWRGLQLDESRHFFGKEEVKRFVDHMFMMKLNVFHWHLTDDQGWRVEIKKYPLLTEKGSVREYTQLNGWQSGELVNERYGGFYTQEDIKEIVEYANERGITVVPEIDFPAHCASAIAAYPWLACRELHRDVPGYFGSLIPETKLHISDWNRPICPGKDKTIEFIFDILDEICDLFPSKYIHIGGDEAPKEEWKKCPDCRRRMEENSLKNEEDLQGWFNNEILKRLAKKGRRLIGWNEILKTGNLDKSITVQYWTPKKDKRAERFANSGGSIIMSNHQSFYFDMTYAQYPLKNTYSYSPEKFGVNKRNIANVLGVEGENWTEWTDSREKLDLFLHPREEALTEVAWTDEDKRNFADFKLRLDSFKDFYDYLGINYAVDKITALRNPFERLKILKKFSKGDTHFEVKLNKKYKAQGEK